MSDLYINGSKVYPLTLIFTFVCAYVVNLGTKKQDKTNQIFCIAKLGIVAFIVTVAYLNFDEKQFEENPLVKTEDSIIGVFEGATITFFGYVGFELGTTLIEEA